MSKYVMSSKLNFNKTLGDVKDVWWLCFISYFPFTVKGIVQPNIHFKSFIHLFVIQNLR